MSSEARGTGSQRKAQKPGSSSSAKPPLPKTRRTKPHDPPPSEAQRRRDSTSPQGRSSETWACSFPFFLSYIAQWRISHAPARNELGFLASVHRSGVRSHQVSGAQSAVAGF